mmetsp:Transcript_28757/g.80271  ORF Transcript_28757/g.80271 Transcript_28757/m.80271 type:complete len:306 (-) Transcript_28757:367-1284(-)
MRMALMNSSLLISRRALGAPTFSSALPSADLSWPSSGGGGGNMASNFSVSTTQLCLDRYDLMSSTSMSPSGLMASNRFSGEPPWASMQTRSLAATSIRTDSFSAKALCIANCRPFAATPSTARRRASCMSFLLRSDVASCIMRSASSGNSTINFSISSSLFEMSSRAARDGAQSSVRAFAPCRSCEVVSSPASLLSFCADSSYSVSFGPMSSNVFDISAMGSFHSSCLASTSSLRRCASSASRRSFSRRIFRSTRQRASSRAMPIARFSSWKASYFTPGLPGLIICLQIRPRLSSGISKPKSSLA